MFLIIDNTEEKKLILSFLLNNKFAQRTYKGNILLAINKLLFGLNLKLKDIKYLGVVMGGGRFTASRLAATVASTLSFSLKIPVIALPKNFNLNEAVKSAQSAVAGKYIVPVYSAEARIG